MSPVNRGSPLGSRIMPAGARPLPPPRFGPAGPGRPPNMQQRIPPPLPPPQSRMRRMPSMSPMFGPGDPRQRIPPPPPPRQGAGVVSRHNAVPPLFLGGPRTRAHPHPHPHSHPHPHPHPLAPIAPPMGSRGPPMRPWPRRMPPQMMPPMRPMRYNMGNGNLKSKPSRNAKRINNRGDQPDDGETQNQGDENCVSSDDEKSHYCEVCDKDFSSKVTLLEHQSTHMTCDIDGCTFSAHPMLVEKHINMQHRTGLYQRMKDLAEDLEKWIMERKKRYPTKANISLRKAEELEKLQRGEIIKQNFNVRNVQTKMKKMEYTRQKKRRPRKRYVCENNNNCNQTEKLYRGLRPFPGTSVLEEDNKAHLDEQTDACEEIIDNISDEDVPQTSPTLASTSLPTINLLPNLVADYESEDNDEGPEEVPVKRIKVEELQDKITENTVHKEISHIQKCKKESDKLNNKSGKTVAKHQDKQKHEMNQRVIDNKNNNYLHRYHDKLLEKLLSRSVQHERNLICQCVKYIIQNNFFDSN